MKKYPLNNLNVEYSKCLTGICSENKLLIWSSVIISLQSDGATKLNRRMIMKGEYLDDAIRFSWVIITVIEADCLNINKWFNFYFQSISVSHERNVTGSAKVCIK